VSPGARAWAVVVATILPLAVSSCEAPHAGWAPAGADADRGKRVIASFGCGACHAIPGVRAARGDVGPSLAGFARRTFIGGAIPNVPDRLVLWILDPRALNPDTAMPGLGLTEREARDAAAYLYTLD
jgi:cytochrome c2